MTLAGWSSPIIVAHQGGMVDTVDASAAKILFSYQHAPGQKEVGTSKPHYGCDKTKKYQITVIHLSLEQS